jgi:hypothetical protein
MDGEQGCTGRHIVRDRDESADARTMAKRAARRADLHDRSRRDFKGVAVTRSGR